MLINQNSTIKNFFWRFAERCGAQLVTFIVYASDPAAPTAAYVAEKMKLPTNPYEAVMTLCNKDCFRHFLKNNGFNTPVAKGYSNNDVDTTLFSLPVIIKPVGFDVIPQVAEEINVPLKKLGKLLILSIVLAVLFYALIVFSVSYAISPMEVDASRHSTGLVTADAMAKVFNSKIMAKVAIIGGMCGIITSWNSFLIGGSRALFALAESYMIPHCFSKLHPKYNTPVLSLLLIGVLSVISPFFGKSMLVWISNSASFACCIAYCMVSISFLVLRKKMANEPRPYKVKHFKFVGVMAIFMAGFMVLVYIFPWFGCNLVKQEWIIIGGWGTLGIIFSAICKMVYKDKYGVML